MQYLICTPDNNLIQTRTNFYSLRDTVARSEGTVQATDTPITNAEALPPQESYCYFLNWPISAQNSQTSTFMDRDDHVLRLKTVPVCAVRIPKSAVIRLESKLRRITLSIILPPTQKQYQENRQSILSLDKLRYPLKNFNPSSQTWPTDNSPVFRNTCFYSMVITSEIFKNGENSLNVLFFIAAGSSVLRTMTPLSV